MLFNLGPIGGTNIEITANGDTYRYTGEEISNAYFKVSPYNTTGWKMWLYASCSVKFNFLKSGIDICVVGKGGSGHSYSFDSSTNTDRGGRGGNGGQVINLLAESLTIGEVYEVTINTSGTSFGAVSSAGIGGGASGGRGGSYSPTGGYSGTGGGSDGEYAFDDSTFDGVIYGHGGDGGDVNAGSGARGRTTGVYANPGAGGAGGGQSNNSPTAGKDGIVLLRCSS